MQSFTSGSIKIKGRFFLHRNTYGFVIRGENIIKFAHDQVGKSANERMGNQQSIISNPQSTKRPLSVTLLAWVVLILASLSWLRLVEVIRRWSFLQSLAPSPPVLYLAITGLIWGLLGTCLVWGLFLGRWWAPRLMQISALGYVTYYWLDRLLIADSSAIASRWPFALGLTITLLAFTFWTLSRPKSRLFFQKVEI